MSYRYGGYPPYVSVAERRAKADRLVAKLVKPDHVLKPVKIKGRTIAHSFWGKAWCQNLEDYGDYANRLPRGRTYARNGSIRDLQIIKGRIDALVIGSDLYEISIQIEPLAKRQWQAIQRQCAGQINSLVDLLRGSLDSGVMEAVSRKGAGLFPTPKEIGFRCSCPDWADMCKHVAATLYGVGARLDEKPDMLFTLRDVNPADMIEEAIKRGVSASERAPQGRVLKNDNLASIFGVDIDFGDTPPKPRKARPKVAKKVTGSRIKENSPKKEPVQSPARRSPEELATLKNRLHKAVQKNPGKSMSELAKKLKSTSKQLQLPMRNLKSEGVVKPVGQRSSTRYFPFD